MASGGGENGPVDPGASAQGPTWGEKGFDDQADAGSMEDVHIDPDEAPIDKDDDGVALESVQMSTMIHNSNSSARAPADLNGGDDGGHAFEQQLPEHSYPAAAHAEHHHAAHNVHFFPQKKSPKLEEPPKEEKSAAAKVIEKHVKDKNANPYTGFRGQVWRFVHWRVFVGVMLAVTVYILFIDDILGAAAPAQTPAVKTLYLVFAILKIIVFVLYVFEWILLTWADPVYRWSFFFWLDLLTILTFAFDFVTTYGPTKDLPSLGGSTSIARAGRAARAAARAARLVKTLKKTAIIMFLSGKIRWCWAKIRRKPIAPVEENEEVQMSDQQLQEEVGAKLIQVTSNKVVAIVLSLFLVVTLCNVTESFEPYEVATIQAIQAALNTPGLGLPYVLSTVMPEVAKAFSNQIPLVYLYIDNGGGSRTDLFGSVDLLELVDEDYVRESQSIDGTIKMRIANYKTDRLQHGLNILLTVFVIFILIAGTVAINNDANKLVTAAIEKVCQRFEEITRRLEHGSDNVSDADEMEAPKVKKSGAKLLVEMLHNLEHKSDKEKEEKRLLELRVEDTLCATKKTDMELRQWRRQEKNIGVEGREAEPLNFDPAAEGMVVSGTQHRLLAHMVDFNRPFANLPQKDFQFIFLLTCRPFMKPLPLMENLVIWYCLPRQNAPKAQLITAGMSKDQRLLAKKYFKECDTNGDGVLDQNELRDIIMRLDPELTQEDMDMIMRRLDPNAHGHLTFGEFVHGMDTIEQENKAAVAAWRQNEQEPRRERLLLILEHWVSMAVGDFEDPEVGRIMEEVLTSLLPRTGHTDVVHNLQVLLQEGLARRTQGVPPLLVERLDEPAFNNVASMEIAKQLTLFEHEIYFSIRPIEFVDARWDKGNKRKEAPHVVATFQHFNAVSRWVQAAVLEPAEPGKRADVMKKFIEIATHCITLNSMSAAMAIFSALNTPAIDRLQKTKAKLSKKTLDMYTAVSDLLSADSSYKAYRTHVNALEQAHVPYIGVYLKDLIYIDEGNEKYTPDGLVNFVKCNDMANAVMQILHWQQYQYDFRPQLAIRTLWRNYYLPEDLELPLSVPRPSADWAPKPPTENELYALSLQREERKKK